MSSALARKVAEIASRDASLPVRETPNGSNECPRYADYRATFGLRHEKPFPVCAAAACTWISDAEKETGENATIRYSTNAMRLWEYNPSLRIGIEELTDDDFPCIWIEDHGDGKGHAGIAVGWHIIHLSFVGISANTTSKRTREGGEYQGVWVNDGYSLDNPKLKGFLRIA